MQWREYASSLARFRRPASLQPRYGFARAEECAHAVERQLDVRQAVRVAEAQEALAVCAESGTRQTRHASVVQQTIRQLATREACPGNVRKGIEGSVRLET